MSQWADKQEVGYVVSYRAYNGEDFILKPNNGFAYKTIKAAIRNAGPTSPDSKLYKVTLTYEEISMSDVEETEKQEELRRG